jgi:hypothetical protein
MTTPSKADFPVEGGRPSLKWGRKISESLAGARITSPDHMISEGPGGTCIKHKPIRKTASDTDLPFVFLFKQTSSTGGDWVQGKGYIAGAEVTIASQPTTISGVSTTTYYWILHDFAAATLTWKSGSSYTDSYSDTQEVYRMLEITCAAGVIDSFICPHPCDIHATAKST